MAIFFAKGLEPIYVQYDLMLQTSSQVRSGKSPVKPVPSSRVMMMLSFRLLLRVISM